MSSSVNGEERQWEDGAGMDPVIPSDVPSGE
jgi:hypothetical protein